MDAWRCSERSLVVLSIGGVVSFRTERSVKVYWVAKVATAEAATKDQLKDLLTYFSW